jgi:hypothetical protein
MGLKLYIQIGPWIFLRTGPCIHGLILKLILLLFTRSNKLSQIKIKPGLENIN